jgi:hypothetical protein
MMKRIKRILYITLFALALIINPAGPVSTMFNIGPEQAYAKTSAISKRNKSAIKELSRHMPKLLQYPKKSVSNKGNQEQANRSRKYSFRTHKRNGKWIHNCKDAGNP